MSKKGKVQFFDLRKGFGFLESEGKGVYFNWSSFAGDVTKDEMIGLTDYHKRGEEPSVTFNLMDVPGNNPMAVDVRQA